MKQTHVRLKKFLSLLIIIEAFCCLGTFASSSINDAIARKEITNPYKIENSTYEEILASSVMSYGNNYRLKRFIKKLNEGDDVYIACLGGSVTEGAGPANYKDGYAYKFCDSLKNRFFIKDEKMHFVNAGLSGTPSPLGLLRYGQDVTAALGRAPDLLIVEFAVNDGSEWSDCRAFEQIIRGALEADKSTAVIALYSAAQYMNSQNVKHAVSSYYGVAEISVQNAFNKRKNLFSVKQFFTDVVHPTKEGHAFVADCLMNFIIQSESRAADSAFAVPAEYLRNPSFSNFKQIAGDDENVRIDRGCFKFSDSQTQSTKQSSKGNFPDNWHHLPSSDVTPFIMKINCKNLFFVYKENAKWNNVPFGSAEIYVDGKKVAVVDENSANGWNNSIIKLIIDEKTASEHEVRIVPQKNKAFTIVAMGYSK